MARWRPVVGIASSVLLSLLAFGCAGNDSAGSDPAGSEPVITDPAEPTGSTESTETAGEPSIEPTDPETTQPSQQKPSIEIASAPIGGNVETTQDGYQCAEVNWLGKSPIPDGTTIKVGSPQLEPAGIFTLDQAACGEKSPPCTADVEWQPSGFKPCYVGVKQLTGGDAVQLILSVSAQCATEAECKSLAGDVPGSQISFTSGPPSG
ncbi:hypothetical protein [Kribbella sp. CA-293567]|uniref:hypothetical protein n=1 Tax=Kribbella sp. CA-293567 TaxID=3002436 RepID=UPI0022DE104F|nr:hypothetical protein [Kribbella sp. CA-293567]WBQ03139.1 hypothetical protein OX958_24535 [Kribbella sp. CA-293567]